MLRVAVGMQMVLLLLLVNVNIEGVLRQPLLGDLTAGQQTELGGEA